MKKILITILWLVSLSCIGQEPTDTILPQTIREIEIVGTRADQKSPVTQTNLTKSDLNRSYQGQDAPFLLRRTPSVTTYSDNGLYNSYSYFRIRGIDQTRVNVTLDGVPLSEPEDQGVYFSNLPDLTASIGSVQVRRGVGTSSNGTTSFVGAVDFEGPNLRDSAWASFEVGGGSYRGYRLSVAANTGVRDGTAVYARYSMIGSDGYRHHSFHRSRTLYASAAHYGRIGTLRLTVVSGESDNGMAYLATNVTDIERDPKTNYLSEDETDRFRQDLTSLRWTSSLGRLSTLSTTVFYGRIDGGYDILFGTEMDRFSVESDLVGTFTNFNRQGEVLRLDVGFLMMGYGRTHRCAVLPFASDYLYENRGNKNEISAFTRVHHEVFPGVVAFGDIQIRHTTFQYIPDPSVKVSLSDLSWTFVNPKVGVRVGGDRSSAYFSVGSTHREPTRGDLFGGYDDVTPIGGTVFTAMGDTLDVTSVRPEGVTDFEAGIDRVWGRSSLHFNVFYMAFRDEIAPVGKMSYIGIPLRKNVGESVRAGVEFRGSWSPLPGITLSEEATLMRARISEYRTEYDGTVHYDVPPLLTPGFLSTTRLEVGNERVSLGAEARYISSSHLDNTGDAEMILPSCVVIDVFASVKFGQANLRVSWNNVFDERYYQSGYVGCGLGGDSTPAYFIGAPRNFFVTLGIVF